MDQSELPPLIDREIFFDDPEIAGAKLSRDGEYLAFLKPHRGITQHLGQGHRGTV